MLKVREEKTHRVYYDVVVHRGKMVKELKKALVDIPENADILNVKFDGCDEVTFYFVVEH
jgi:hypothetical protein